MILFQSVLARCTPKKIGLVFFRIFATTFPGTFNFQDTSGATLTFDYAIRAAGNKNVLAVHY